MQPKTFCSGKTYKVLDFNTLINREYKQQLLNLGIFPGIKFKILRFAPLGETIQIAIGHFSLMLRKHDLNQLDVQEA